MEVVVKETSESCNPGRWVQVLTKRRRKKREGRKEGRRVRVEGVGGGNEWVEAPDLEVRLGLELELGLGLMLLVQCAVCREVPGDLERTCTAPWSE